MQKLYNLVTLLPVPKRRAQPRSQSWSLAAYPNSIPLSPCQAASDPRMNHFREEEQQAATNKVGEKRRQQEQNRTSLLLPNTHQVTHLSP